MYYLFRSELIEYDYHNGHDQTIIFLHGWGGDKNSFAPTIRLLMHKFNILTITLPTTNNTVTIWQLKDYAEIISILMRLHSIISPIIVCHSFGFRIYTYLNALGIQFHKAVITGGAGIRPHTFHLCKHTKKLKNVIKSFNLLEKIRENNRKTLLKNKKFNFLFNKIASPDYRALSIINNHTFKNIINFNTINLVFFRCKILLFWGKNDKETPIKIAHFIKKYNNCKLLISDYSHFSYLDNNSYFNHSVMRFLS